MKTTILVAVASFFLCVGATPLGIASKGAIGNFEKRTATWYPTYDVKSEDDTMTTTEKRGPWYAAYDESSTDKEIPAEDTVVKATV